VVNEASLPPDVPTTLPVLPGTPERWWERSAFKQMVGVIALAWLPFLRAWIAGEPMSRDGMAAATDESVRNVLMWAGVISLDRGGLRKV
jgi:hypothetical protein